MDRECRTHSGQQGPCFHAAEDPQWPGLELLHPTDVPLHLREQADGHHCQSMSCLQAVRTHTSSSRHGFTDLLNQYKTFPQKILRSNIYSNTMCFIVCLKKEKTGKEKTSVYELRSWYGSH